MGKLENLRLMNTRSPEERRELGRRGGIASGARRREIAEAKKAARLQAATHALIEAADEEARKGIERYIKAERAKAEKAAQRRRQSKARAKPENSQE